MFRETDTGLADLALVDVCATGTRVPSRLGRPNCGAWEMIDGVKLVMAVGGTV